MICLDKISVEGKGSGKMFSLSTPACKINKAVKNVRSSILNYTDKLLSMLTFIWYLSVPMSSFYTLNVKSDLPETFIANKRRFKSPIVAFHLARLRLANC